VGKNINCWVLTPKHKPYLFGGARENKHNGPHRFVSDVFWGRVFLGGDLVVLYREAQELWTDAWREVFTEDRPRLREGDIGCKEVSDVSSIYIYIYIYIFFLM